MPVQEKNRKQLLQHDVARAAQRRHRPCKNHGRTRIVCQSCARVYCPQCELVCPHCGTKPRAVEPPRRMPRRSTKDYIAPEPPSDPRLRRIQSALLSQQVIAITPHKDSGGWQAEFPYLLAGYHTAAQLGETVYRLIREFGAQPTNWGCGRLFKPDRWFVSFTLPR